jgi:type VI secretion system protein ImpA
MPAIHVEALLESLGGASPCGADIAAGNELYVLESEARGKPEQQFGEKLIPAVAPNWIEVRDQAQALLKTTRDLRVVIFLMRAATRLEGLEGYCAGLRVLRGLLDTQWDHVHPLPDVSDGNDPWERLNALGLLADRETLLADLRAARIGPDRVACSMQELEQAFLLRAEADSKAERHSLRERMRDSCKASPTLASALQGCASELAGIEAVLALKAPGRGPDFKLVSKLLAVLDTIGKQLAGQDVADAPQDAAAAVATNGGAPRTQSLGALGDVNSRADAARVLGKVSEWLEKNEPSHPAPLFIKRAQRLLEMSFMEIMQDLVPESVASVETLAGIQRS